MVLVANTFASSDPPRRVRVGRRETVQGLEDGLLGACLNERRRIKGERARVRGGHVLDLARTERGRSPCVRGAVPPQLGYGSAGQPAIPANAHLVYEVTVVDIEKYRERYGQAPPPLVRQRPMSSPLAARPGAARAKQEL
jgi:hypothetical protein